MTRVLVVEDDAIIGSDIAETLVRLGYDVPVIAESSAEALHEVSQLSPDVVLMDIQLRGGMDGVETVERLRRASDVPVIYLTAHTDEATLARAKETGPHGYLVKPFNERDLRTAIEVAIRKHELERHVAERERWFSTTLASLGDGVIAADAEGCVTFMNPAAEAITGFTAKVARGRPLAEVFRLVELPAAPPVSPPHEGLSAAVPRNVELVDRAGERHVVDDRTSPIVDEHGVTLGRVVVFRDVTERERLERRLEVAERLASLGTMASGLAHELNNPLAAVMGNVAFVLAELDSLEPSFPSGAPAARRLAECRAALKDAASASERLRKVVATMRWFVNRRSPSKAVVDLRQLLETALKLTEETLARKARVLRRYGAAPLVDVDEEQFVQVFVNLLTNAADAIVEGEPAEHELGVVTWTDEAGRAVVEIRHDGESSRNTAFVPIFEPAYAATVGASGTGLGLSISHSFVLAAGGELTVQVDAGAGGAFRVRLPAASRPRATSTPAPPALGRRARVLVVDDELSVAKVMVRLLPEYEVTVETDARAAVSRIERGEQFDVVFCDLMMPGWSGADVYEAIRSHDPRLVSKLVFLTGGAFGPTIAEFLRRVDNRVINKPFTGKELRLAVAALADA